jgi:hypothetical protein
LRETRYARVVPNFNTRAVRVLAGDQEHYDKLLAHAHVVDHAANETKSRRVNFSDSSGRPHGRGVPVLPDTVDKEEIAVAVAVVGC